MRCVGGHGGISPGFALSVAGPLGVLDELETIEVETADQRAIQGVVCRPVGIQIENRMIKESVFLAL